MGVDLRLLPVDSLSRDSSGTPKWGYSHTVLRVPRTREMWSAIESLGATEIPRGVNLSSFVGRRVPDGSAQGETMYGQLRDNDAYGVPYTWIATVVLRPVFASFLPGHPVTAYLDALADDTLVVLDWH